WFRGLEEEERVSRKYSNHLRAVKTLKEGKVHDWAVRPLAGVRCAVGVPWASAMVASESKTLERPGREEEEEEGAGE
ncbi:hypothetical protein NDU88_000211, partial [Pleurodeles waltl]